MGDVMKVEFVMREDGWMQMDAARYTFLIGDTNEVDRNIGLWVTGVGVIDYRLVRRERMLGGELSDKIDVMEKEARALIVLARIMGVERFEEYLNDRREECYDDMALVGDNSVVQMGGNIALH